MNRIPSQHFCVLEYGTLYREKEMNMAILFNYLTMISHYILGFMFPGVVLFAYWLE